MTAILVGEHPPHSPEWHALRHTGIGASEIATVLGLNPWQSPFSLWHIKAGNVDPDLEGNAATHWGTIHEPAICDEWARLNPWAEVRVCGTYRHPDEPWMLANPDRLVHDGDDLVGVLEAKTARYADGWGPDGSDEIPVHYRAQVMQQMHVMGVPVAYVAVLIGGSDFRSYTVDYDPGDAAHVVEAGRAFWQSIADGVPPDIDASEATGQTVRRLHPDVEDVDVLVDTDLADGYLTAVAAVKDAERVRDGYVNRLLDAIGDGRVAVTADGVKVATRSVSIPKRFDRKAFAAAHPDLEQQYTVAGEPVVRLTPTVRKTKS